MSEDGDALELTVLGSSSSIPRPGRACSAYLVRADGRSIVFDLGSGSFANLRKFVAAEDVDAVVISHMHPDHFLDLVPMRYALRYGNRTNGLRPALYLPPGGEVLLRRLTATFPREATSDFLEVYDVRSYGPEDELRFGEVVLRFALTRHYIPAFAVRCEWAGKTLAYSADTAPEPRVAALARSVDAFVCEATLDGGEKESSEPGHSSAAEAGAMAQEAAARRLVLTHYGAGRSAEELVEEARTAYSGEIIVADDGFRMAL